MTPEELKQKGEILEANRRSMRAAFKRTFGSDDGKKVIDYLVQNLIYDNETPPDSLNIEYVAGYKDGEAGAVKLIIKMMTAAEND